MVIAPHMLAGTAVAANFERLKMKTPKNLQWLIYAGACVAAVISHLVLDRIPHPHYTIHENYFTGAISLSLDFAAGLTMLFAIFAICNNRSSIEKQAPGLAPTKLVFDWKISQTYISFWMFWLSIFFCLLPDVFVTLSLKIKTIGWLNQITYWHNLNHTTVFLTGVLGWSIQLVAVMVLWQVLVKFVLSLYKEKIFQYRVSVF